MVGRKKKVSIFKLLLAFMFTLSQIPIISAYATGSTTAIGQAQPSYIERQVDQEFTINYTINPQDIPRSEISAITDKEKEIVLVIDTSGSMSDSIKGRQKLMTMKDVAKNFIDKFIADSKVSIALIEYNSKAEVESSLVKKEQFETLKNKINSLSPNGGTNIGDGLRRAYHILKNGNVNADKYIILMTDGVPTAYTAVNSSVMYNSSSSYYNQSGYILKGNSQIYFSSIKSYSFEKTNSDNSDFVIYYGDDYISEALNYSKEIGQLILSNTNKINTSVVGLGSGTNSSVLGQIAQSLGTSYVSASDESEINKIYTEIANKIIANLSAPVNVTLPIPANLEVTSLPQGLSLNSASNTISGTIGTVNYKLNGENYKADPINFSLSLKGKASSSTDYIILGSNVVARYSILNKNYSQSFNNVNIKILNKQALKASISTTSSITPVRADRTYKQGEDFYLDYIIDPSQGIEKSKYDDLYKRNKEIVLVVDTSGSMNEELANGNVGLSYNISERRNVVKILDFTIYEEIKVNSVWYEVSWGVFYINGKRFIVDGNRCYTTTSNKTKLEITKEAVNLFLNEFSGRQDTKISIITYNNKASNPVEYSTALSLNSIISNADGGTNIGDGLRKAYYTLKNSNTDVDKYIVLMTDGEPTSYSIDSLGNNYLGYGTTYTSVGGTTSYSTRATEYARQVMNVVNNDSNTKINTFMIAFSEDADDSKLQEIAGSSERVKVTEKAKTAEEIQGIYSQIASEIKLPVVKDIKFEVNLPKGLEVQEIRNITSQELINNFSKENNNRSIYGLLDNINYNNLQVVDGVNKYTVDPAQLDKLKFRVKVRISSDMIPGEYTLGSEENSSFIQYTDIDGSTTKKSFTPEITMIISTSDPIVNIEKLGLFQKVSGTNILEYVKDTNVQLLRGVYYELGSVLEIGCENESERGKSIESNIKITISNSGVNSSGSKNIRLYSLNASGQLQQIYFNNNANGVVIIPPEVNLIKGNKYILTQDFVVNQSTSQGNKVITNSIKINESNDIKSDTLNIVVKNDILDIE